MPRDVLDGHFGWVDAGAGPARFAETIMPMTSVVSVEYGLPLLRVRADVEIGLARVEIRMLVERWRRRW